MARPRKYKTVKDMQRAIDEYFAKTKKKTICGLTLHLGFATRQSLLNYKGYTGKDGESFADTIDTAKTRIEQYYEENLVGNHATGSIFALKQFGWKDRKDIDVSGEISLKQPMIK